MCELDAVDSHIWRCIIVAACGNLAADVAHLKTAVDTLPPQRRSALMKRVRRSDTTPEVILRKEMHHRGFRYLIGDRRLPGTPDLVFPRYKAIVFVHGCFWHGHDCRQGRAPSSNIGYWEPKIAANRQRDARKEQALHDLGWRVFTVWECQLKKVADPSIYDDLAKWLRQDT